MSTTFCLALLAGLEPATKRLEGAYSIPLSYRSIFNRIRFGLFNRKIFAICGKDPKTGDTGEIRTHGFSALQALALDHSATVPINWTGLAPDWTFL